MSLGARFLVLALIVLDAWLRFRHPGKDWLAS